MIGEPLFSGKVQLKMTLAPTIEVEGTTGYAGADAQRITTQVL